MKRRSFLRNTTLLALTAGVISCKKSVEAIAEPLSQPSSTPLLKAAFISDVHIRPSEEEKLRKAIRQLNGLSTQPSFIISGGDTIWDAMSHTREDVEAQWKTWDKVMAEENKLPIYHAIGNHDIWGWKVNDHSIKNDPLYGKNWMVKRQRMSGPYYSFNQGNWKFIVLDSVQEDRTYFAGYMPGLDDQQFAWLKNELASTSSHVHVCIVSHVPIISFCAAVFSGSQPNGDWVIPPFLLHSDSTKLTNLFSQYHNIRCCLSGHIHLQDAVEYKGITYFCNGALSGKWWEGSFHGIAPAFALFDFHPNGEVKREIVNYA